VPLHQPSAYATLSQKPAPQMTRNRSYIVQWLISPNNQCRKVSASQYLLCGYPPLSRNPDSWENDCIRWELRPLLDGRRIPSFEIVTEGSPLAGCVINLKHFKWTFPFGGCGTILSRSLLEALMQLMHCSASTNASLTEVPDMNTSKSSQSASAIFCPRLMKDWLEEYHGYRPGMALVDACMQI
jgi:hypothetical protein